MGYYRPQGDFYAGARGDPGIGSFFRGLVTKATSFIPGVGPVVSGVLDKVLPGGARVAPGGIIHAVTMPAAGGVTAAATGAIIKAGGAVKGAIVKHPVLSAAGAAGALGGVMGAVVGKHMRGEGKKHRRMNVCNPRALRRAIRRARGFTKLAMKTIHIVHPKKKGRFGGFKKRRRAA